jgi:hypothetical protein
MRCLLGFLGILGLLLSGCPPHGPNKGSGLPPCSKFGDNCEFSPGKLGSCVVRDGCTGDNCFTCQSQH